MKEVKTPLTDRLAKISAVIHHIFIREGGILDLEAEQGTDKRWAKPAKKIDPLLVDLKLMVDELDQLMHKANKYLNGSKKETEGL